MRGVIAVVAFVGLAFSIGVRAEVAFGPASAPPAARAFPVGKLNVVALHDAQFVSANDAKTFGVDVGATAVSDLLRASAAPTDRITLSVNALLVHSGKRVLLLDTGLGPKAHGD